MAVGGGVAEVVVIVGEEVGDAGAVGYVEVAVGVSIGDDDGLVAGLGDVDVCTVAGDELVETGEAEFLQLFPAQPLASALGTPSDSMVKAAAATTAEVPTDPTERDHDRATGPGRTWLMAT